MIDSRIWDKKWSDAHASGIDGFTIGFKPGTHPGPIHWEKYCDICKKLISCDVLPRDCTLPHDFCDSCCKFLEETSKPTFIYEI